MRDLRNKGLIVQQKKSRESYISRICCGKGTTGKLSGAAARTGIY